MTNLPGQPRNANQSPDTINPVRFTYPFAVMNTDSSSEEVNFSEIWRILWRRKWLIAAIAIVVTGGATVVVQALPPHYLGDTLILVGNMRHDASRPDAGATGSTVPHIDSGELETEIEILKSPSLAIEVIRDLHLGAQPEPDPVAPADSQTAGRSFFDRTSDAVFSIFGRTDSAPRQKSDPSAELNEAIANFSSRLQVTRHGESRMLSVTFDSNDPTLAAAVPNALADRYIGDKEQDRSRVDQGMSAWLKDRISELQGKVEASELAVQKYQSDRHLFFVPDKSPLVVKEMTDVAAQLELAREQLSRVESGGAAASSGSDVGDSAQLQDLRRQEAEIRRRSAALSTELGDQNPKSLAVDAELRQIRSAIAAESRTAGRRVAGGRQARVKAARATVTALQDRLKSLQKQVTNVSTAQIGLAALEREAAANRLILKSFLDRSAAVMQNGYSSRWTDAEVVSRASPPTTPAKPRRGMLIIIAAICGLTLGSLLAYLLEKRTRTYRTASEVEKATGLRPLGLVPMTDVSRVSPMTSARDAGSPYNLALRLIYTRLSLLAGGKPTIILVTSAVPGEGKTNLALSLAAMAAHGDHRTALVDVDFWEARASQALGLRSGVGFAEFLEGKADLARVVVRDIGSGIDLIRPGKISPGYDFTSESDWVSVLTTLGAHYEFVIIDAPPILAVTETSILTAYVDTVVIATRWNHTPRRTFDFALKRLRDTGANIAGFVMTRVDERKHAQLDQEESIHFSKSIVDYYSHLATRLNADKLITGDTRRTERSRFSHRIAEKMLRLFESPTRGRHIARYDHSDWALLVVDGREDLLGGASSDNDTIKNINELVAGVHMHGALVISALREFRTLSGKLISRLLTSGHARHPIAEGFPRRLDFAASETFVTSGCDIFSTPDIEGLLNREQIDHLCIVGSDRLGSVRGTARAALDRGYRVTLIMDCIVASHVYPFERISADLKSDRVTVLTCDQFLRRLRSQENTVPASIAMQPAKLVVG